MGNPITWRNVTGPDPAQAAYPMAIAQQTLNGAFDQFSNIIKQREAGIANAAQLEQENLKTNFLAKLQSVRTPEELAALQASGGLDQTGMTAATRALVMGAPEARITSLRQGVTAEQDYNAKQLAQSEVGRRDAINSLIAAKKFDEADAAIASSNLSNRAALVAASQAGRIAHTTQTRQDAVSALNLKTAQLTSAEAERTATEANRFRGIEQLANAEVAASQEASATRAKDVAPLLQQFNELGLKHPQGGVVKVTYNPDGSLNKSMDKETQSQLEKFLADNNSYTLSEIIGSDTTNRAAAEARLRAAGATTKDLVTLGSMLDTGLSTAPKTLMGDDLNRALRTQRLEDVAAQEASKQFVPLSDPNAMATVANSANETINKLWGADTDKAEYWRRAMDKFLKNGIMAGDENGNPIPGADGKPIRVIPSAETVTRLLNTVNTDFWRPFGAKSNDLEARLKEYMADENIFRDAGRAVRAGLQRNLRSVDPVPEKK